MGLGKINFEFEKELAKNSKIYLDFIINNAPLIYFILDENGVFLASKGKGLEDMGIEPDQFIGSNAFNVYSEFDEMKVAINKALNGTVAHHSSYVKATDRYYRTTMIPINQFNKSNKETKNYVLGISTDETESMRAQRELIDKEKQIHEYQKIEMLGKLSRGLAHEFNNLLQSIIGLNDLLSTQLDEDIEEAKKTIDRVSKVANKGKNITFQLLSLSSLQIPNKKLLDINNLISSFVQFENVPVTKKDIKIVTNFADETLTVMGNEDQFKLIFSNLIRNSYDAIVDNGTIYISTSKLDDKIQIIFRDTGGGIPKENIKQIFELFYSTKIKGLGIGLATVKSIINLYNGTISVSNDELGAVFIIQFPITYEKEGLKPIIDSEHSLINLLEGKRIIVIDDEDIILQSIKNYLKNYKVQIQTFLTALDAKNYLFNLKDNNQAVDIIVSDIRLPNFSGIDLLENLQEDNFFSKTKILLISGFSNQFLMNHSQILSNNVKFLSKPFARYDFFEILRSFYF